MIFESAQTPSSRLAWYLELDLPTSSCLRWTMQTSSLCSNQLCLLRVGSDQTIQKCWRCSSRLSSIRIGSGWSIPELHSARVGSPSFESARVIDFSESLEHTMIESALHPRVSSSVHFSEKFLIWHLEYIELTFWSTRPLCISSSLPYRSNPHFKTSYFIKHSWVLLCTWLV